MVFLLCEPFYVSVGHFFVQKISNTLNIGMVSRPCELGNGIADVEQ
jgi:hypothetical protein